MIKQEGTFNLKLELPEQIGAQTVQGMSLIWAEPNLNLNGTNPLTNKINSIALIR